MLTDSLGSPPQVETDSTSVYVTADPATITASRPPPSLTAAAAAAHIGKGVVIIGGGSGALATVEELRESGYQGPVKVISAEPNLPIDRTKLSKALISDPAKLAWRDTAFYEKLGIQFVLSTASHPYVYATCRS